MTKHPLAVFLLSVAVLILGAVTFIQSESFAHILKTFVARHLPADLGIQADFSDLSVGLFPPSVSIRNPKVSLSRRNLINLPPGSSVTAKRIDLRFRFFQMFSGNIRIHEVAVVDGDVKLLLHATEPSKSRSGFRLRPRINWDELFQIRADAVALENTHVHLEVADSGFSSDLTAEQLRLAQWRGRGGLGYELRADLKDIRSSVFKGRLSSDGISRLSAIAHVNREGAEVDDLSTILNGMDVHLSGKVRGNVLTARELPFESRVILKADLSQAAKLLPGKSGATRPPTEAQGTLSLDAQVQGDLLSLERSVRAQGELNGENVRYGRWNADHVAVEAAYSASKTGGEIRIERALIASPETPREGGFHPASGGQVELGAFSYALGSKEPVTVPVKLENAHIQWLAADQIKSVYPIDARISGGLTATFRPASGKQPWGLQAGVDLSVEPLQLDNQRYGQDKPLRRVFRVSELRIQGPVTAGPGGVSFSNVKLSLPHTQLAVNGSVTGRTGYDLVGKGPTSLGDFQELAEAPIAGDGTLSIHVHGPASSVLIDFDADLKNARYLNLRLGDLKGRITWQDGPQVIVFSKVAARAGQTPYVVDGKLDLGAKESIDLGVEFDNGNIFDVSQIFDHFTKELWWFPRTMSGPVNGTARLTGGISMSQLKIAAHLSGTDWEYLGERIRSVDLVGGYDRGKYEISSVRGLKQHGGFEGRISYDADGRFDWAFSTRDLLVTDLDHLARLDVPFRGKLELETRGHGREASLESDTTGSLTDFSVRGISYPESRFELTTRNGMLTCRGNALGNQATLDLAYGLNRGTPSSLQLDLRHFDFAPTILLLNPNLMQDPALMAYASGSLNLDFLSGQAEKGTGNLSVGEYHLAKTGTAFQLTHPLAARVTDGVFDLHDFSITGPTGTVTASLRGTPSRLAGHVGGKLDLGLAEFLTPTVARASGVADLDLSIEGVLKAPSIYGDVEVEGGNLRIPAVDSPFENITGTLHLKQNLLTIDDLESDLGGGRVRVGGTMNLFPDKYPTLALKADLRGTRVRVYPFQFVKLRGNLGISGEERPYLIDGALTVDSALSKEKVLGHTDQEGLQSLQYTPTGSGDDDYDIPFARLKIGVTADHGIMVQNDLFRDTELKAKVTVVNTLEAPRIIGNVDLIQGKMAFKDRVFQIQSANAVFDNPTIMNPQFNLTATTDVSSTKVQLYASGRMPNKWKVDLTSNPAMSESEILSLLAVGNIETDPSKRIYALSVDRSAVQQGEAAQLLLQSMDFNREVQEKTGLEFQLDEYANTLQGQSLFSRSVSETVSPRIIVKKRVGDRLTLSYGSTVGTETDRSSEATAEYRLTNGLSFLGVWDSYEFQTLEQQMDSQSSYGFDLKLQKRFK